LKNETTGEPNSFDFTIESVGVLDPMYIVSQACEAGIKLCEKYTSERLPQDVLVQPIECLVPGFDFFFQKQDHTLGNLMQAWIEENLMNNGTISFVGYDIPHPLRDEMVLRLGIQNGDEATARDALRTAMNSCKTLFHTWLEEWRQFMTPTVSETIPTSVKPTAKRTILRRPGTAGVTKVV
jgi:DNA-directed RNA polymerase subunit L